MLGDGGSFTVMNTLLDLHKWSVQCILSPRARRIIREGGRFSPGICFAAYICKPWIREVEAAVSLVYACIYFGKSGDVEGVFAGET